MQHGSLLLFELNREFWLILTIIHDLGASIYDKEFRLLSIVFLKGFVYEPKGHQELLPDALECRITHAALCVQTAAANLQTDTTQKWYATGDDDRL